MTFYGHQTRKRFGQHWLKDSFVLGKIIESAKLESIDRVLEIGPGKGALTEKLLLSNIDALHAIELDRELIDGLRKRFEKYSSFTLQEGDVLSVPLLPPDGIPSNKVVANIPYNITGPLLERLIGRLSSPVGMGYKLLVLLLQKEVADRILAKPGNSAFSALSVRIQLLAKCRSVCEVEPKCFQPPPKVCSKVISIEPVSAEHRLEPKLARGVETLLRAAFLSRRKMLRNSLKGFTSLDDLEIAAEVSGVSLNQRPQELSPREWVSMAKSLNKKLNFQSEL